MGAPPIRDVYRPRRPTESPLYRLVAGNIDKFESVYAARYQSDFGFWRPVIREVVDEYLKCGDLKNGFARIRCKDCGHDFLVAFSCKKRCFCATCHQKRTLIFAERMADEICATVPHRQFVFTIPKRLRIYFRFDRSLLGKLSLAAWETLQQVYESVLGEEISPGMVASIQTFGELIHWHPHIHAIATDGGFREDGTFVPLNLVAVEPFVEIWKHKVFRLLLDEGRITEEVVAGMLTWKHSGFSVHREVHLAAGDKRGIENLSQYISRCPFSLSRIIRITPEGNVLYRAEHGEWKRFPGWRAPTLPGISRNFEVFKPLDFLAQITQHIPDRSQHLIRYYGWYSNRARGRRRAAAPAIEAQTAAASTATTDPDHDAEYRREARKRWARLIKKVYEADPLVCPKCNGVMSIVAFITEPDTIHKILDHIGEAHAPPVHPTRAGPNRPSTALTPPARPLPWDGEEISYPEEWAS